MVSPENTRERRKTALGGHGGLARKHVRFNILLYTKKSIVSITINVTDCAGILF